MKLSIFFCNIIKAAQFECCVAIIYAKFVPYYKVRTII